MIAFVRDIVSYRELVLALALKNIIVRYKQAYFGLALAILKPLMLMLIFCLVRSFVGIDTGSNIPYPILTFAALLPWILFQEATAESVASIVNNALLIKKIYFPREVFPLTAVVTKVIELGINLALLALMMAWYRMVPTLYIVWVPLILAYTILVSLCIGLAGAALNVYYRDVAGMLPVGLQLLMYASPVIYPLSLVKQTLLIHQAAGEWSHFLYTLYTLNPLAGIIDAFQRALFYGQPPDFASLWPGLVVTLIAMPLSHWYFKHAESYFADVI